MLSSFFTNQWSMLVYGLMAAAAAGVVYLKTKRPAPWLLAIAVVLLAVAAFGPWWEVKPIDPQLPWYFRQGPLLRLWLFACAVVALLATTHVVLTLVRQARGPKLEEGEGKFADIDAAWQEILIRLNQAGIDPARQRLYLLFGPDEGQAAALVDSAQVQLFGRAPAAAEAPIHAYAVADGLLLSCAGASGYGRPGGDGPERLAHLCRRIRALNTEEPVLRGVAVLLPVVVASGPEQLRVASAVRDDLNAVRAALRLRCPCYAVFTGMEAVPGFDEFVARVPPNLRQSRCGFSIPGPRPFRSELAARGLGWMRQWFRSWSLDLMVQDVRDRGSNSRLMLLNNYVRRHRGALLHLLDAALSTHEQAEPVLFRGCYFVSNGAEPHQRAFAAGLIAGRRGRLLVDHQLTSWSREADRLDARYRRLALGLGLGTAAVALPIWAFGIIARLGEAGVGWLGWAGLAALGLGWAVVLAATRRGRSPAAGRPDEAPAKAGHLSAA